MRGLHRNHQAHQRAPDRPKMRLGRGAQSFELARRCSPGGEHLCSATGQRDRAHQNVRPKGEVFGRWSVVVFRLGSRPRGLIVLRAVLGSHGVHVTHLTNAPSGTSGTASIPLRDAPATAWCGRPEITEAAPRPVAGREIEGSVGALSPYPGLLALGGGGLNPHWRLPQHARCDFRATARNPCP
jgi:hypothetical protein